MILHKPNKNRVKIGNLFLCDLLFSASIRVVGNHARFMSKFKTLYSCDMMTVLNTFELLGLTLKTATTKTFKEAIKSYLKRQSKVEIFNLISYIFRFHATLSPNYHDRGQIRYYISDSKCLIRPLLDSVGFKYKTYGRYINIIKGSFFINGRWIHIG